MKPRLEKIVEDNKTTETKVFLNNLSLFLVPLIVCSLGLFLLIFFDVWHVDGSTDRSRYIVIPVAAGFVTGIISWSISPKMRIKEIVPLYVWVNRDAIIEFHPQTKYKIPDSVFKKEFKDVCSIDLYSSASVTVDISFLREAQEVRKLLYTVELGWHSGGRDMQIFLDNERDIIQISLLFEKNRSEDSQGINVLTPFLYYHILEMREKKGKELAKLYNPKNKEQQDAYLAIIRDYFGSMGYRFVINGSFALPGEIYTPW